MQGIELLRNLEVPATTWLHTIYCHSFFFYKKLNGLKWCGNWAVEAGHRQVKQDWQKTPKRGGKEGGSASTQMMLQQDTLRVRLTRVKAPKRQRVQRHSQAFYNKVLEQFRKQAGLAED